MEGAAHKAVWVFIVLCWESVLMAFPTISLYHEGQSTGLPLEGIVFDGSDTLLWRDADGSVKWTIDSLDSVWYSAGFEQSDAAGMRPSRAPGLSDLGAGFHYANADRTRSMALARAPADARFASSAFWMEVSAYPNDGLLRLPPRRRDSYR